MIATKIITFEVNKRVCTKTRTRSSTFHSFTTNQVAISFLCRFSNLLKLKNLYCAISHDMKCFPSIFYSIQKRLTLPFVNMEKANRGITRHSRINQPFLRHNWTQTGPPEKCRCDKDNKTLTFLFPDTFSNFFWRIKYQRPDF